MSLVDKLKKLPFEDAHDKASGLRKKAKQAAGAAVKAGKAAASAPGKGVRKGVAKVKKAGRSATESIPGYGSYAKTIRKIVDNKKKRSSE